MYNRERRRDEQEESSKRQHSSNNRKRLETRPYYKQTMQMFSPTQTGLTPRRPAEVGQNIGGTIKGHHKQMFTGSGNDILFLDSNAITQLRGRHLAAECFSSEALTLTDHDNLIKYKSSKNKAMHHQPSQPRSRSSFGAVGSNYSTLCYQAVAIDDRGEEATPASSTVLYYPQQAMTSSQQPHQSALSRFAAEIKSSSRSKLRDQRNYRNQERHAIGHRIVDPVAVVEAPSRIRGSLLHQSRSSSNMILNKHHKNRASAVKDRSNSRSSKSGSRKNNYDARSDDHKKQRSQRREKSLLRNKASHVIVDDGKRSRQRSSKQRDYKQQIFVPPQYPLPQRSLKDCKNELKQDRLNKAVKRRHSSKATENIGGKHKYQHKSRSKKTHPEVVVVYRYPNQVQNSQRTATSAERNSTTTPLSSTDQSFSMNALHTQLQREYSEDKILPTSYHNRIERGTRHHLANYMPTVISTEGTNSTRQQMSTNNNNVYLDSSVPISPSDHNNTSNMMTRIMTTQVESTQEDKDKQRYQPTEEMLVESAEQIIKNYLRKEKRKNKKKNSTRSSSQQCEVKQQRTTSNNLIKSRQSTKNQHLLYNRETVGSAEGRHHGIKPYMREDSSKVFLNQQPHHHSSKFPQLTPSELADSSSQYLVADQQSTKGAQKQKHQFQKRQNGPFLYYQQQVERAAKQQNVAAMSSRPHEVIVSDCKSGENNYNRSQSQIQYYHNYASYDDSQGISEEPLSSQKQNLNQRQKQYNLEAEYKNMMTQQQRAFREKMLELESIKNQVQQTAAQISRVHEHRKSREQQLQLNRSISNNQRSRSLYSSSNQPHQQHTSRVIESTAVVESKEKEELKIHISKIYNENEDVVVADDDEETTIIDMIKEQEERSTEKRQPQKPFSKLGQRYISFLQRNKRSEDARKANIVLQRSKTRSSEREKQLTTIKQTRVPSRHATQEDEELLREEQSYSKLIKARQEREPVQPRQVLRPKFQEQLMKQRETSPPAWRRRRSPYRHKSVENMKQYAISKIIGRFNSKKAPRYVYQNDKKNFQACSQVQEKQQGYQEAQQHMQMNVPEVRSQSHLQKDFSKSSFIDRLQKYHRREVSRKFLQDANEIHQSQQKYFEQRSHSHIDLHNSAARYYESRNELIPDNYRPSQIFRNYDPLDYYQTEFGNSMPFCHKDAARNQECNYPEQKPVQQTKQRSSYHTIADGQSQPQIIGHNLSRDHYQNDEKRPSKSYDHQEVMIESDAARTPKLNSKVHEVLSSYAAINKEPLQQDLDLQQEQISIHQLSSNTQHHNQLALPSVGNNSPTPRQQRQSSALRNKNFDQQSQQQLMMLDDSQHQLLIKNHNNQSQSAQNIDDVNRRQQLEFESKIMHGQNNGEAMQELMLRADRVLQRSTEHLHQISIMSNSNKIQQQFGTTAAVTFPGHTCSIDSSMPPIAVGTVDHYPTTGTTEYRHLRQQSRSLEPMNRQQVASPRQSNLRQDRDVIVNHGREENTIRTAQLPSQSQYLQVPQDSQHQQSFSVRQKSPNNNQQAYQHDQYLAQAADDHAHNENKNEKSSSYQQNYHQYSQYEQHEQHEQNQSQSQNQQQVVSHHQISTSAYKEQEHHHLSSQLENRQQQSYNASQHFSHRIAELQRQTNEVQKLPEFYNDRVMSLKKRTLEVQEIAMSFTSGENSNLKPPAESALSARRASSSLQQQLQQRGSSLNERRHVQFDENQNYQVGGNPASCGRENNSQNYQPQLLNNEDTSKLYTTDFQNSRQQSLGQGTGQQSFLQNANHYLPAYDRKMFAQTAEHHLDTNLTAPADRQPHHAQVLSQEIILHHQNNNTYQKQDNISSHRLGQQNQECEFQMTQRLEQVANISNKRPSMDEQDAGCNAQQKQLLSRDTTNRGGGTGAIQTGQTVTTERADDNPNIVNDEGVKARNKERRRQKRERKLQKLKELHDKAQYSMSQIASGLTSQAAFSNRTGEEQKHNQQWPYTDQLIDSHRHTGSILTPDEGENQKTTGLKSTVEKLANTRKEIKKLIKIQNKHSKLLKKLQKSGTVNHHSAVEDSNQQLLESQASNLSMSQMSENQKQMQMAQSTGLLRQMQDIFKYLAQIQEKLDFEIEERKRRSTQFLTGSQVNSNSALPLQMQSQKGDQNYQHHSQNIPPDKSNLNQRMGCYQDSSSLTADLTNQTRTTTTGLKLLHTQQNSQNQQFFGGVNQQHLNSGPGAISSDQKINSMSQGTTSTLFWDTQMAYNNNTMFNCGVGVGSTSGLTTAAAGRDLVGVGSRLQTVNSAAHQENAADARTTNQSDLGSVQKRDSKGIFAGLIEKQQQVGLVDAADAAAAHTQRTEPDELEFSKGNPQLFFEKQSNMNLDTPHVYNGNATVPTEQFSLAYQHQQINSQAAQSSSQTGNFMATAEGSILLNQTSANSTSLTGIRVEQLCDILSREISKVREESVVQAHEMRYQYEQELQQLRNEFYQQQKSASGHSQTFPDFSYSASVENKDIVQQRQMELFNHQDHNQLQDYVENPNDFSGGLLNNYPPKQIYTEQVSQRVEGSSMQPVGNQQNILQTDQQIYIDHQSYNLNSSDDTPHNHEFGQQRIQQFEQQQPIMPHTIFAELEKVKAERDEYFEKLMKVRSRIAQGKQRQSSEHRGQGNIMSHNTERTESSPAQMQSGSFQQRHDSQPMDAAGKEVRSRLIYTTVDHDAEATQESHNLNQQYQTDFNVQQQHHSQLSQRNHQQYNDHQQQQQQQQQFEQQDFSGQVLKLNNQQNNTFHSMESNPSSFNNRAALLATKSNGIKFHLQDDTAGNQSSAFVQQKIQNNNKMIVGKIVHQFRTFEPDTNEATQKKQQQQSQTRDGSVGSRTSKTRKPGEICRKPGKYVNVRHNRTSMMRQNKANIAINLDLSSQGKKCHSCLMSSTEIGNGGSQERSFKSNHSSTSQTRKVTPTNMQAILSSVGGGLSSNFECTMCHNKINSSVVTTPFIYSKECGPNMEIIPSGQSSTTHKNTQQALQQKRARTPNNENMVYSYKDGLHSGFPSNGGFVTLVDNKQHAESHALPSQAIGGRQTLQSMMPRPPDLINRLAAEHEQLYLNSTAGVALESSCHQQQTQQTEQNGGSIHHDNSQHNQSRALQVIQHYLEKYDNKQ